MPWLRRLITRLFSDPQKSWQRFKLAVGLFLLAVILIFAGATSSPLLQILGLVILASAIVLAAWGYIGILFYRLTQFNAQSNKKSTRDDTLF